MTMSVMRRGYMPTELATAELQTQEAKIGNLSQNGGKEMEEYLGAGRQHCG